MFSQSAPIQTTKLTYTIRWSAWTPGKDKQVALTMCGGEILPSDELFVYKPSTTVLNNTPDVVQENLRFNYRFDTDVNFLYLKLIEQKKRIVLATSAIPNNYT